MYEAFYGLKEKPFSIQPDPEFLFFSLRHSMAYAMLEYGVQNRAGFSVICGEIGCGKTTLVRHLLNNLGDELTVGIVYNTHEHIDDLLGWIMLSFGQPYEGKSNLALYDAFQQFFQRVSVDFFIPPLESFEADKYIHHRLHIAGRDAPLFTAAATRLIGEASRGIPRSINILCDTALVYGYSTNADKIDVGLVREVIKDRAEFGVLGI